MRQENKYASYLVDIRYVICFQAVMLLADKCVRAYIPANKKKDGMFRCCRWFRLRKKYQPFYVARNERDGSVEIVAK